MVSCFHYPNAFVIILSYYLLSLFAGTIRSTTKHQYQNETIYCTDNEACTILCQHESACHHTRLYCAADHECTILCQEDTSCANAVIHAEHASSFQLLDCATGSFTCRGIHIYFPPNDHGIPRASIIGADTGLSAGSMRTEPLQFYAIHGWNDITINTSSTFTYQYHAGIMHCTSNLHITCDFNTAQWQCAHADDICNDPTNYDTPRTLSPTFVILQTDTQRQFVATPSSKSNMLYAIIAVLMCFLCCFAFILIYYMYYSEQYTVKLPSDSHTSMQHASWTLKFKSFPSISGAGSNASTMTTMTTPKSVASSLDSSPPTGKAIQIAINEKRLNTGVTATETKILKKYSDDSVASSQSGDVPVSKSQKRFVYNRVGNPVSIPHVNTQLQPPHLCYPTNPMPLPQGDTQYRISMSSLPSSQYLSTGHPHHQQQQHVPASLSSEHDRVLYAHGALPPQHYLVPSVSYHASMDHESSGNEAHIMYQAPSQQQMMHMLSMMNQSNPPSLSSFVKNNENGNYVMNQQPIEPSAQSSSDNSVSVQPHRVTITSENHHDHYMKVPPPAGSVLSAFTSVTLSDRALSEKSQDDDDTDVDSSRSESNLNELKALDAVYVD